MTPVQLPEVPAPFFHDSKSYTAAQLREYATEAVVADRASIAAGDALDAARYRWLRRHGEVYLPAVKDAENSLYRDDDSEAWDGVIDAAMFATKSPSETNSD